MHDSLLSFCQWLEQLSWVTAVANSPTMSPAVAVAHFFSFFLLVGTIAVIDLRLLGLAGRRQTLTQLAEPLFPWTWTGLGIAVLSGFLMFAPEAASLFYNAFFWVKLLVILPGVAFALIVQRNLRRWEELPAMPFLAKLAAFISLALWIGILLAALEVANY